MKTLEREQERKKERERERESCSLSIAELMEGGHVVPPTRKARGIGTPPNQLKLLRLVVVEAW